jgi:hypothetical protein
VSLPRVAPTTNNFVLLGATIVPAGAVVATGTIALTNSSIASVPAAAAVFAGKSTPSAALTAKAVLDHVINTSQIVEAQSAAIIGGHVVLSAGQ